MNILSQQIKWIQQVFCDTKPEYECIDSDLP